MADLNSTISFLTPYYSSVEQLISTISFFVGGIFGVYLIILVIRLVYLRKTLKFYKDIKSQMSRLEEKVDMLAKKKE